MLRYAAACCQTDLPAPRDRASLDGIVKQTLALIDRAVMAYAPFAPVKLVVLPEYVHAAPVYFTAAEIEHHLAVELPNEYLDAYIDRARRHQVYIQPGTFLERDPRWPGHVFNTACLVGPEGLLLKYRKVHPWLPWEVHSSPHDVPGGSEPLFPVVDTPLGKLGVAIGCDFFFPEAIRQLALAGAEVILHPAAIMDPWATPPLDWWAMTNRCRAMENLVYVVACNQGASGRHQPPFSYSGGSMIVDPDGRPLAQAELGAGEKIVFGVVDVEALRQERRARRGHYFPSQLRTEAYGGYTRPIYPAALTVPSVEENEQAVVMAKRRLQGERGAS